MNKLSSLSIFFPALNDAKSLPDLIRAADRVARKISEKHEIIVVNDGSTDNTKEVIEELKKEFINLRIISHEKNEGYGAALRDGFKNAKYDWIFYTDGDAQYNVEELKLLVSIIASNPCHPELSPCHPELSPCHPELVSGSHTLSSSGSPSANARGSNTIDIVNGYKIKRGDGLVRSILGALYNILMHLRYHLPIRDVDCDFRLIRKSALDKITLSAISGSICVELISKLAASGAQFAEVPVHHFPRKYGKSQFFSFHHLLQTVQELFL
ncbi:MAG: glycosyltransferase family 2 protein [Patescibacteria group bacterium]